MRVILFFSSFLIAASAFQAFARDYVTIVGSSTVFPFATAVAEQFGNSSSAKTPIVESTGSGGGIKLFCNGVGLNYPDIVNTSRRIKSSELEACEKNNINVVEFSFGTDGVVMVNSKKSVPLNLSEKVIFTALAEDNGFNKKPDTWAEVALLVEHPIPLPDIPIRVYGPPSTSGTRDAFVDLIMSQGAKQLASQFGWDKETYEMKSKQFRSDRAFINMTENDNLAVRKIDKDIHAVAIFGFSFLDNNLDRIQGVLINGVAPTFDNIALKKYPAARPLFFYVKKDHMNFFPDIRKYVEEFISKRAIGEEGYLTDIGLIPLEEEEFKAQFEKLETFPEITTLNESIEKI